MISAPDLLNPREKNSLVVNITYGKCIVLSGFHSKSEGKLGKGYEVVIVFRTQTIPFIWKRCST